MDAPVFVFEAGREGKRGPRPARSLQELEVEAARILTNYVDWISENRQGKEAFQRQCDELGFEIQFTDASEEQSQRVFFISRRGIPAQRVTVLLQGTLLDV